MTIDYKYSELVKPLSFTEFSPSQQVDSEPSYQKLESTTEYVYQLTPCIP